MDLVAGLNGDDRTKLANPRGITPVDVLAKFAVDSFDRGLETLEGRLVLVVLVVVVMVSGSLNHEVRYLFAGPSRYEGLQHYI
jgi:hypothetical protein